MAESTADCPYELSNEEIVFNGQWMKTRRVKFVSKRNGNQGVWESAHRQTKDTKSEVHGADIIAILKKEGKKFFIFVKQYRIPMKAWCLEFPAGLIDDNESAEESAIRELKEETGYCGKQAKILHRSQGVQGLDPGLTDDSIQFITMEVDGDAPENQNPEQNLEHEEEIEVVLVECSKLMEYIHSVEKDLHVEAMVYSFAIGYSLSNGKLFHS